MHSADAGEATKGAAPRVAIVGRPNVGKSTLFNRLIGERRAVMHEVAGTTRDRLYGTSDWRGIEMTVVDTGVVPRSVLRVVRITVSNTGDNTHNISMVLS